MSTTVKRSAPQQKDLPKEGLHHARCIRVIDLGNQDGSWNGQPKVTPQIALVWELVNTSHVFDEEIGPQPFVISHTYTNSFSTGSHMYAMVSNWNQKVIDKIEADGKDSEFDMKKFLGQPCIIKIVHNKSKKNGLTYANIGDKGRLVMNRGDEEIADAVGEQVHLDLDFLETDPDKANDIIENKLWGYQAEIVKKSHEYRAYVESGNAPMGEAADEEAPFDVDEEPADEGEGF